MTETNVAQALNDAMRIAMEADERVLILGEDVGRTGGVFRITDGLYERFGADRVIDTPVAESGIAGAAFGLAVGGMRPIAEIQFMGFSYPAFDQVVNHISRIRNRTRHRFSAPLVMRVPCGGGIGAAEHHSESTEAYFVHTPGLKVVMPSTPYDAKGLLLAAIEDPDPVIFCEPIRTYRAITEDVPDGHYTVPIGEARVVTQGTDVTLISYGAVMSEVREAARQAGEAGVAAEVIDLRSLVPLDIDTVLDSVRRTGRAVIVHEAQRTAGLGAELSAQISEQAILSLEAPVARVTGWDIVVPLKRAESYHMPTVDRIVRAMRQTLEGLWPTSSGFPTSARA